jgi:putative DNA primase/helicase
MSPTPAQLTQSTATNVQPRPRLPLQPTTGAPKDAADSSSARAIATLQGTQEAKDIEPLAASNKTVQPDKAVAVSAAPKNDNIPVQPVDAGQPEEPRVEMDECVSARIALNVLTEFLGNGSNLARRKDGKLIWYDTCWTELTSEALRRFCMAVALEQNLIGEKRIMLAIRDAVQIVQSMAPDAVQTLEPGAAQPPVINTLNGEVWLKPDGTIVRKPHSPESGLPRVLPIHYDPKATCPLFEQALLDIFRDAKNPPQLIAFMLQLIGYLIQPTRKHAMVLLFVGDGCNGKSFLVKLIERLLPTDAVYRGSISEFKNSMLRLIIGKMMFVDSDLPVDAVLDDALLKKLSEDTTLTVQLGRGETIEVVNQSVPVLLCNKPPALPDLSPGMRRRITPVPFGRSFNIDEVDVTLFDRIVATELPGILNKALQGWQQLVRDGRFIESVDVEHARRELIEATSPLAKFIAEACTVSPGKPTKLTDLFASFERWAADNGLDAGARYALKGNLIDIGNKIKKIDGFYHVADLQVSARHDVF